MIKVKWLFRFSRLRFSEQYRRTFQLSRQIRACINLQDLAEFVESNDADIQRYGKTIVLEHFNQYPLNFTYRTIKSELHVYEYALGLQNLTLYEEQLRYANLCKMIEYAPWDAREMEKRAHQQERRIIARTKNQPFDLVDALNWILYQRAHISSELVQHSLDIICSVPLQRSQSIIAKLLSSFLKKIEQVQWRSLRRYRPIFDFLCDKYEFSIQSPKIMVSNFEKLTALKLHLLGYDRIPKAIDQMAARLEQVLGSLDMYHLQMAFKSFDNLPASYNRKLFGLLYNEIIKRLNKQVFQLNSLPLNRLTRKELDTFMKAFVANGLYMRNCIYFINCEQSKDMLSSQVFLKALIAEFLQPIKAQNNLIVDYSSYMSVGHALLTFYEADNPLRPKIIGQLRKVHDQTFKNGQNFKNGSNCSLCGWFNIFSIDLEIGLFANRRQFLNSLQHQIKNFIERKFNSAWKSKKHHQQLREIIKKHADSPHIQIRNYMLNLLRADLSSIKTFDSNYFPPYIYMLEECENTAHYQSVLEPLYSLLRGEDALAFIDTYIRTPKKSAKVTLKIMEKLWKINHKTVMILKLAGGVPLVYFESGIEGLLAGTASILEEAAAFVKIEDLDSLSEGQLIKLMRFCHKFVKHTPIMSHKLLLLTLGKATKMSDKLHLELPIQLLNLILSLNSSDKEICINRINELLQTIEENSNNSPLTIARLIQGKLMLKGLTMTSEKDLNNIINSIVQRVASQKQLQGRAKVMVILLKLSALEKIQLNVSHLKSFCEGIKDALRTNQLHPSDLPILLGNNFIKQAQLIKYSRLHELKEILSYSLGVGLQQEFEFYIYLLRLAHKIHAPQLIQSSLDYISLLSLEPSFVIVLVNILKHYTFIYRPELIQTLLKETTSHFYTFKNYHIDILYYINIVCYEAPITYKQNLDKLLIEVEKGLNDQIKIQSSEKNPDSQKLFKLLVKIYKYFWIVIKNNQVTNQTLSIFKFNIMHIKKVFETVSFKSFDGISSELIFMIHLALFPNASKLQQSPKQQVRKKFFSNRKFLDQYEQYHEYMRKMEAIIKTQAVKSFMLEEQLGKMKIYYKQVKQTDCYFTFGEKKQGIQLHYNIRNGKINHYIFIVTPKMRNNAKKYKGRVKLFEQLYKIILNTQPVIYDENDPIIISLD